MKVWVILKKNGKMLTEETAGGTLYVTKSKKVAEDTVFEEQGEKVVRAEIIFKGGK